jgi:hypothetical protein
VRDVLGKDTVSTVLVITLGKDTCCILNDCRGADNEGGIDAWCNGDLTASAILGSLLAQEC